MKGYYLKSSFQYPKNDPAEPGGPGGVARFAYDLGGTAKRIQALGCDTVMLGFDDVKPDIDPLDAQFIECVEAARMGLIVSVWLYPRTFSDVCEFWSRDWYKYRCDEIWAFVTGNIGKHFADAQPCVDCEFYAANHPYRKDENGTVVKDLPWTPFLVRSLRSILWDAQFPYVMPIGKQHADAVGYAYEALGQTLIDWNERYDNSQPAYKDPITDKVPANPPPNAYPSWWVNAKPYIPMRWCNHDGSYVKAGSIWRKLWKATDFNDGIVYVDDREQAMVLA